jgi:Glycosyl hydrolases family 28
VNISFKFQPVSLRMLVAFCWLAVSLANGEATQSGQDLVKNSPPDTVATPPRFTEPDADHTFDVTSFGAKGDGVAMDTEAIQSAINAASRTGAGVVVFPAGKYLCGSLWLKSHMELHLARGATLLGSTSRRDYQKLNWYALLLAQGLEDIKLSGEGTIDGQGLSLVQDVIRRMAAGEYPPQRRTDRPDEDKRPSLIAFNDCRDVKVSGLHLRNSSGWVENYNRCKNVTIDNIKVDSVVYWNNDGIDITDCSNVSISHCDINSSDDGICLKSGGFGTYGQGSLVSNGCDHVTITDCRIRSSASALKFGTASFGSFRNIHVFNLTIYDTYRSAMALEIVDGGTIEHVLIENIHATNTGNAVFLRLGQRNIHAPPGIFHDVVIRNLHVEVPAGKPDAEYQTPGPPTKSLHNVIPSSIVGIPNHPVKDVLLENVEVVYSGNADPHLAQVSLDELGRIPEKVQNYPEFSMFGELPAWGFYLRHAEGIEFRNVRLTLIGQDYRPALVCDDVKHLHLNNVSFKPSSGEPVVALLNTQDTIFQDIHYLEESKERVRLLGHSSPPEIVVH